MVILNLVTQFHCFKKVFCFSCNNRMGSRWNSDNGTVNCSYYPLNCHPIAIMSGPTNGGPSHLVHPCLIC